MLTQAAIRSIPERCFNIGMAAPNPNQAVEMFEEFERTFKTAQDTDQELPQRPGWMIFGLHQIYQGQPYEQEQQDLRELREWRKQQDLLREQRKQPDLREWRKQQDLRGRREWREEQRYLQKRQEPREQLDWRKRQEPRGPQDWRKR